ncbi:helix-hairpin-helix domain-containing protein [Plebeiibacterium marinum]|uniref:Helix-hairpin-helix domain-containing protein n=1 Tax=Plebeiibacterium marinum TaxID=2992111 RepID=A0AAE3SIW6_9BACT|nr:helix-hairpin-helix domain-containing protein [Plebeiobacterium marinum]MCW3805130.1 helix-hairpin-helix domain-containing protein [Plebeiobacterium marinum]
MKQALLIFTIIYPMVIPAQNPVTNNAVTQQLLEYLAENDNDISENSQSIDDLIDQANTPININNINKSKLEKLWFLSDFQARELLDFIDKYQPIFSKYQLQSLNTFTPETIELLSLFVTYGKPDMIHKNYLNGNVIIKDAFDIQKAKGYQTNDSSAYLGNNHQIYSRAIIEYGNHYSTGFVIEKDPGEQFLNKNKTDFYSGFLQYKGNKLLKKVIIGDFKANFGQGLALWTGSNMSKSGSVSHIRKKGEELKRYSSTNETNFFRGIASSLAYKSIQLQTFISTRNKDARIEYDSTQNLSLITSMPQTGYHRTLNELSTRNTLKQTTYGVNINYRWKNISASAGTAFTQLDADSIQTTQTYKQLNPPTTHSQNHWLSYNYGNNNFIYFGEIAIDKDKHIATLNGFLIKPTTNVTASILYRNISTKYYSPYICTFSESTNPSGETGCFIGLHMYPIKKLETEAHIDIFKFNWLKYNIDKPSNGYEISIRSNYKITPTSELSIQYKEKEKHRNLTTDETPEYTTKTYNLKKIRLNISCQPTENWRIQLRTEKSIYQYDPLPGSSGFLSFADLHYESSNKRLSSSFRYTIFATDDYNSRIYTYENDVLYTFSIPAFYDEGSRVYFTGRYQLTDRIKLWIKAGHTWYPNKKEIGSGLQTISGNSRTNLKIQLQIKL